MTTIESNTIIAAPLDSVYSFLEDCNNHEQLQPENIYNWTSTRDEAHFTIKNMAKLALKIDKRIPNTEIVLLPIGETPFDVSLRWQLSPHDTGTLVSFTIQAELNMMMKMVAKAPLQTLVNHQVSKLKEIIA